MAGENPGVEDSSEACDLGVEFMEDVFMGDAFWSLGFFFWGDLVLDGRIQQELRKLVASDGVGVEMLVKILNYSSLEM